jgi:CBS domain-containing protein
MNEKGAMDRAEEFIQLFNRVEDFLSRLVNRVPYTRFERLIELASTDNAAVRANANALGQFAKLRNAIVHDEGYPPHIVAMPSPEALSKFKKVVYEVIEPTPLIPTFKGPVRCFSPNETLLGVLGFMRTNDFSQVVVKENNGVLRMITVEGIAWWLADQLDLSQISANTIRLDSILGLEPEGCFAIMGPEKTIFDAADAFRNSIHSNATRLYAILITEKGGDQDNPIGFVTPWDLVHNPRLREYAVNM